MMNSHLWLMFATIVLSKAQEVKSFLQISDNDSGKNDEGLEETTKITLVFLLNVIACIFCCCGVQLIILFSKRMNTELMHLRRNYREFEEINKYKEFRQAYTEEKEQHSEGELTK